ncbi:MAG: hypothetical protein IT582_05100 [Opitutaceae bacterium]|nr:hypothetical protein [Opitutaceae bacterium]
MRSVARQSGIGPLTTAPRDGAHGPPYELTLLPVAPSFIASAFGLHLDVSARILPNLFFDWFATNHPNNHFWGCSGFDF